MKEAIHIADSYGGKLVFRLSNSHGVCYSVQLIDKYCHLPLTREFWGNTPEEALSNFIIQTPFNGSEDQKRQSLNVI
jgi:hypothetical protein